MAWNQVQLAGLLPFIHAQKRWVASDRTPIDLILSGLSPPSLYPIVYIQAKFKSLTPLKISISINWLNIFIEIWENQLSIDEIIDE